MLDIFPLRSRAAWACVCALSVGAAFAERTFADDRPYRLPPFDRYQPILDRMPFGAAPAAAAQTPADQAAAATEAEVKAEQQALAKQISMSAVNVTPKGQTAIGFTDRSVNPPANYYLRVGESANGWTVKHADFDDELATLEKDGVAITLKLGEGLVDAPAAGTTPAPPPALAAAGVPRPATAAAHGTPTAAQSFVDRLRERAVQKSQAEREAEARMREQFERLARETAAREIQRRQEEEALAAEERALLEQQAR